MIRLTTALGAILMVLMIFRPQGLLPARPAAEREIAEESTAPTAEPKGAPKI